MTSIPVYSAILFMLAAWVGYLLALLLCKFMTPYDDGPEVFHVPLFLPLIAAALVGASYGHLLGSLSESLLMAPAITVLSTCLYTDAKTGLISEWVMIPAILIVLGTAGALHNLLPFAGAVCSGLPFAIAALRSKGLAMGWGDVYLAVYAGALLGVPAILASALSVVIMYFVTKFQQRSRETMPLPAPISALANAGGFGRSMATGCAVLIAFLRCKPDKPVAFAPYLVSTYALAIGLCS